eukprot:scaffold16653_cov118-Isochrysis_galbana.AAC.6
MGMEHRIANREVIIVVAVLWPKKLAAYVRFCSKEGGASASALESARPTTAYCYLLPAAGGAKLILIYSSLIVNLVIVLTVHRAGARREKPANAAPSPPRPTRAHFSNFKFTESWVAWWLTARAGRPGWDVPDSHWVPERDGRLAGPGMGPSAAMPPSAAVGCVLWVVERCGPSVGTRHVRKPHRF